MTFQTLIRRGLPWTMGVGGLQQVAQFLLIAFLARLLEPSDFGYYAALSIILALAQAVTTGLGAPYIVYVGRLRWSDLSAATIVASIGAVAFSLCIFFFRAEIAHLFSIPDFELVLLAATVGFISLPVSSVCSHYAFRRGRFKTTSLIEAFAYLFGFGVVAITMAAMGYGYWALVAGLLANLVLSALLYLAYFPVLTFRLPMTGTLSRVLTYGGWILWAKITSIFATQADKVIVSSAFGPTALGLYSRGYQLSALPADVYGKFGDKVFFSAFSKIMRIDRDSTKTQMDGFLFSILFGLFFAFPLYFASEHVVRVVFGPGWEAAAPVVSALAIAMPFRVGYKFLGTILRAQGSVRITAIHLSIYAGAILTAAWGSSGYGVVGVATAVAIVIVLHCVAIMFTTARLLGWDVMRLLRRCGLIFVPFVAAGGIWSLGVDRVESSSFTHAFSICALAALISSMTTLLSLRILRFEQ